MCPAVLDRPGVLAAIGAVFDRMAAAPAIEEVVPGFREAHRALAAARAGADGDELEARLAACYCLAHGSGGAYAGEERREFDRLGGYWCHAGGFEPLALAGPFITPETRLADFGAGNGFQGMLLQLLHPHRSTTLVEIGGPMIEQGRRLRQLLGIPEGRVRWLHASVTEVSPAGFDVVYLYRPLRPTGPGRAFYEVFARDLAGAGHPVTVVSVADCLKDFLPPSFRVLHDDGQVAVFSSRAEGPPRDG